MAGLTLAGSLMLTLSQQVEESLAILLVKLPMAIPIEREQCGVKEQHEGSGAFRSDQIIPWKGKDPP